ncbi:P-loop containing nucleoside triphosphate hydrolase protein [Bisporella sp. PMI_857]|nr:P-loop containing nucleoside triphosphate hydrolase protein [Bisporella sp. PMI_857]
MVQPFRLDPSGEQQRTLVNVFEAFVDHFNESRASTEITFARILRNLHPDHHITCTLPSKIDLKGYAAAGHAKLVPAGDESTTDSTRLYNPPKPRLNPNPGELYNTNRFCQYSYLWEQEQFVVYEISYEDRHGRTILLNFILSRKHDESAKEGERSIIDKLLLVVGAWTKELHDEIYVFDDGYWAKNSELWSSVQDSYWTDVIIEPAMKNHLIQDVQSFFDNQDIYKKLSVPWKRGLIFHGVPGNGKTISIKALINSLYARPEPVPSLYVKSFVSCNGQQYSICNIFAKARKMAPCLLIFEDLDSLIKDETRSYFLNEVDGLESNDGILMIGSTNHLDLLDPAISKRPSRFDRKYHFKLPGEHERAAYSKFWRDKVERSGMVDFPEELIGIIAKMTEGFSFAYLKELFVMVLLSIARGNTGDEEEEEGEEERKGEVVIAVQSEDEGSNDGHVVVDHIDAKADEITATTEVTKMAVIQANAKPKRVMPKVEVPEHLKENALLKVMTKQIKTLLDEMDNTEDNGPSGTTRRGSVAGFPIPPIRGYQRAVAMPLGRAC